MGAGGVITITTPWDFGALAEGQHLFVATVNQSEFTEAIAANNVFTFTLDVRPDLMVSPYYLWIDSSDPASTLVTVQLFNTGPVTATDVIVNFYQGETIDSANLLFSRTVAELVP